MSHASSSSTGAPEDLLSYEFTPFWLPLMDEHVRTDSVDIPLYCSTLVRYLEAGYLRPEDATLGEAHKSYVLDHGLHGTLAVALRKFSFRVAEVSTLLPLIQKLVELTLALLVEYVPLDAARQLETLTLVLDLNKSLYRISAGDVVRWVRVNMKSANAWADPNRKMPYWSEADYVHVAHNINLFGTLGGFDAIRARLAGSPMPMDVLIATLKFFVKLRPVMGPVLKELRLELPQLVFHHQLLDLGTDDLRRVDKRHIEDVANNMRIIMRVADSQSAASTSTEVAQMCDTFCMDFALKCLRSKLQDKKYNGLTYIQEAIERVVSSRKHVMKHPVIVAQVPGVMRKTRTLLDWIIDNEIVDTVFNRENMRHELIECSKKIIKFLQQENELRPKHVALIMDAIHEYHHEQNADVRDALYDTLIDSADKINKRSLAHQIWDSLRCMDRRRYCPRTVRLLERVFRGSRDVRFKEELLCTLYELTRDTTRASLETTNEAVAVLPQLAQGDLSLVDELVERLSAPEGGGGLQSLKLLVETFAAMEEDARLQVTEKLLVEAELFNSVLAEMGAYKRQATRAARHLALSERELNAAVLWGRHSHFEAVEQRLHFIARLLEVSDKTLESDYFPILWDILVCKHTLTTRERDYCVEWMWNQAAHSDTLINDLFEETLLDSFEELSRSESGVRIFVRAFFCVNSYKYNLRLVDVADKTLVGISANFDALAYPYVGVQELLRMTLTIEDEALFGQLKDLVLNLFLKVDPVGAITPVDTFRTQLAVLMSDVLCSEHDVRLLNRALRITKDAIVLTKAPVVEEAPQDDAAMAGEMPDAYELAKPEPPLPSTEDERTKVLMFLEMVGPLFPEDYRFVMGTLILKDLKWDTNRAVEDFLFAAESVKEAKIAERHSEAQTFRKATEEMVAGGGSAAAATGPSAAAGSGVPVSEALSESAAIYERLFALFEVEGVDKQLAWEVLKLLRPNERLTVALAQLTGHVDWGTLIGARPSYQLLYSLELVRQFIPTESDSASESERKTQWCRAFLHNGGFVHLFGLLREIALKRNGGDDAITRTCLGHLLRILYYFMKTALAEPGSEISRALTLSRDGAGKADELRFSVNTTSVLEEQAPFDEFPDILWTLVYDRANDEQLPLLDDEEDGEDNSRQPGNVVTYAMFLLVGAILSRPALLDRLLDTRDFAGRVVAVLCAESEAVRHRLMQQLQRLCDLFVNGEGPEERARQTPASYFVPVLLAAVPRLDELGFSSRSQHLFELLSVLLSRVPQLPAEASLGAVCDRIVQREMRERSSFSEQDQTLAGLLRLAGAMLARQPEARKELGAVMVPELLHGCLFSLNSKCKATGTRRAAFELLGALCAGTMANWAPVVTFFAAHQLRQEPVTSWRSPERNEKRCPFVGVRNLGATCYMNASLQQMYMMPALRHAVLTAKAVSRDADDITWQVQRLFGTLAVGEAQYANTEDFCNSFKDVGGGPINVRRQEDASEFIARFQEVMEKQLKGQPQEKVFTGMFGVSLKQEIECVNGHIKQSVQETEPVLIVEFKPTLNECLSITFPLAGDPISDYRCDECNDKVDIAKRHMIHRTQDHLVISLKRFRWDYGAGAAARVKLTERFEIPHHLNLGEYSDEGIGARKLGKQLPVDPSWKYQLHGIIVHSGRTMDSGHYYSIIRDARDNRWYKFDDREVTPFNEEWLDESHAKFIGEAYILFFQRSSEALRESQRMMAGSVHVPDDIEAEVMSMNREIMERRRYFETEYLDFMHALFQAPPEIPEGSPLRMQATQLGTLFAFETYARAPTEGKSEVFGAWVEALLPMYKGNAEACTWLLTELLGPRTRWLRHFLLDCDEPWLRTGFSKVLQCAMDEAGGAPPHAMAEALFSMMEIARPNWRKMEQYMALLAHYCSTPGGRYHILHAEFEPYHGPRLRVIAFLIDWYMGSHSPSLRLVWEKGHNRTRMADGTASVDLVVYFDMLAELLRASCVSEKDHDVRLRSPLALPGSDGHLVVLDKASVKFLWNSEMLGSWVTTRVNEDAMLNIFHHFAYESIENTMQIAKALLELLQSQSGSEAHTERVMATALSLASIDDSLRADRTRLLFDMAPLDRAHTSLLHTMSQQRHQYYMKGRLYNALFTLTAALPDMPMLVSYLQQHAYECEWIPSFFRSEITCLGMREMDCRDALVLWDAALSMIVGEQHTWSDSRHADAQEPAAPASSDDQDDDTTDMLMSDEDDLEDDYIARRA